jgi:hypothetical protein
METGILRPVAFGCIFPTLGARIRSIGCFVSPLCHLQRCDEISTFLRYFLHNLTKLIATIKGDKFIKKYGKEITFNNPALFPEQNIVDEYFEPYVIGTIITPGKETSGNILICS